MFGTFVIFGRNNIAVIFILHSILHSKVMASIKAAKCYVVIIQPETTQLRDSLLFNYRK